MNTEFGDYPIEIEEFLRNEVGVLLTRGVNGLYIYACDEELRNRLKECI